MTQIVDKNGLAQEVNLSMDDYAAAFKQNLSLPQYLNQKYGAQTDPEKYGTPFEQALASNGLFLTADNRTGIKPPSMKDVLGGLADINMNAIIRPDGSQAQTLTGRLLFPAAVLEMIASELTTDETSYQATFNQMIATTFNSDSPRVDQPIINLTAPRGVRSQPISQLALPPSMVSITLSETSFRLPTISLGIEFSNESLQASTLDLVGIALREQAAAERAAIIDEAIYNMVYGDTDLGMSALTPEDVKDYDSALDADGEISNKAWIKWLRKDWKKMTIDWAMMDLDSFMAIEKRSDRPVVTDNTGNAYLTSLPLMSLPGIPNVVRVFPVETATIGANTIVGIDSTKAIRKVTYVGATYQAIEEFVLRKGTAMRFDFSENYFRLIDQGWKMLTLTAGA